MPKTQTISVREFRQNLSLYLRATEMKRVHFVVTRHGRPIAKMTPEKPKKTQKQLRAELISDLRKAEAQIARGEWYTTEELRRNLGLPPSPFSGRRARKTN